MIKLTIYTKARYSDKSKCKIFGSKQKIVATNLQTYIQAKKILLLLRVALRITMSDTSQQTRKDFGLVLKSHLHI